MKGLKIAIFSISIIVFILIIILVVTNRKSNSNMIETESPTIETEPIQNANIEMVTDRNEYYTIKYILDTYFKYINYIDANATELELSNISNQDETIQKYTKIGKEGLKNIIDEEYFKINQKEIIDNSANYKNKSFKIDKIYYQEKTLRKTVYFAYLTLDYNKEMKIIIKVDSASNCFSILPEDYINNYYYSEKDLNKIEMKDIKSNTYNEYEYISLTDKMMAQSYLEDYKNMILNNINESYEMLDEEYKKYKFQTLEQYKKYIQNSRKDYEMLRAIEYYTFTDGNYKIYSCKDQYGNIYVFKEIAIMDYTVQLDDYTLQNLAFNKKYNEVNARDKGILNVDKFFKMINMQDYTSAYALLDENFKQNYFKTQSEFENYMKTKVFRYNKVEYKEYSNKITDIYTYKIGLTDITGEKQGEVEFNVIIKLLEGTEFVMSFTVN